MESNDSVANLRKKNEKKYYTNREQEKMPKRAERPKKLMMEASRSRKSILSGDPLLFDQKCASKTQTEKVPIKSFQGQIN